ncbi:hypothetical protein F2Q69_00049831 [Brassica cretica]|uniref:Secreted protein n=1 Tax=Brassica cretica TaxID=69181 RepID=A0A8S9PUK9_BRACR|nr:hypothetical protein F2Q69_00049831 [Brassica cretica]
MLLPPLCLLGLALVSPGNFTDLGCRLRLSICERNPRSGGSQSLCSNYYDQDRETRRLSDGRRDAGLRKWRGRKKHFLEDG